MIQINACRKPEEIVSELVSIGCEFNLTKPNHRLINITTCVFAKNLKIVCLDNNIHSVIVDDDKSGNLEFSDVIGIGFWNEKIHIYHTSEVPKC